MKTFLAVIHIRIFKSGDRMNKYMPIAMNDPKLHIVEKTAQFI